MNKELKIIADRITELLNAKKWYQVDLAYKSGVSQVSISHIMQCKHYPKDVTLEKIAAAFGVYKEYLTGQTDFKNINDWIDMRSRYNLSADKEKCFFDMLQAWGYIIKRNDDIMLILCPDNTEKMLYKKHIDNLLHNFFIMFDSLLLPADLLD